MKIAVECQSPLLQKSLDVFLSKYLTSTKSCDIVVRDSPCVNDKRCFYVSSDPKADLIKPFSKSQLILALESRYSAMNPSDEKVEDEVNEPVGFEILEKRIDSLTKEYQRNVLRSVKAFYEK